MNNRQKKWWVSAVLVCCLAPAAFAIKERGGDRGCDPHRDRNCQQQVPEGGSTAVYLLGAGLTCFGAMFVRSRIAKPAQL